MFLFSVRQASSSDAEAFGSVPCEMCIRDRLVYRLLEAQLDDQKTHVTPANLVTTLKNMTVTNIHDIDFMALYKGSKTLDALTQLTRMPLDRRHYRPKDLNGMIKKFLS